MSLFEACQRGDLSFFKERIRKLENSSLNAVSSAFCWVCRSGHLKVAKWIKANLSINVRIFSDTAFRWACENGHLRVAKWLLNAKPSFSESCNEAFWTFRLHYMDVAKWLKRQCPTLSCQKLQVFSSRREVQLISFFN
jgi:hypothetical protein